MHERTSGLAPDVGDLPSRKLAELCALLEAATPGRLVDVPRISEFFGMAVYMYWFDTQKHQMPHIHVRYQGAEAVFDLDGLVLEGDLGTRAERLIAEWCAERRTELRAAWECAAAGKEVPWVLPLR